MSITLENLYSDALSLLSELITPYGFLASSVEADNYKRIWARDSVVCGIAGLWSKDEALIEGLSNSLQTLADYQHETGMIPSNVLPTEEDVSYGSLVGRIDATTWFVLGACLYYKHTRNESIWHQLKPAIEKAREYLKACEFNDRGWIYTPLSGNWADEYPIHGYTLYDNVLRLWGESLFEELEYGNSKSIEDLKKKTKINFWPQKEANEAIYQQGPYEKALQTDLQHFIAFILPGIYDTRFDAAGNALALLFFDLSENQKQGINAFVHSLKSNLGKPLIPAFWPIMDETSSDWYLLEGNHSFSFKNTPGNFHNGGIWPVWMGLFCLGLAKQGLKDTAKEIALSFYNTIQSDSNWDFQEFLSSPSFDLKGKTQMGYTASGIVFMKLAMVE